MFSNGVRVRAKVYSWQQDTVSGAFYGWVPECACPSSPVQVRDVLKQNSKQLGTDLQITGFVRVQVGEGLEAEEKDFAKEVEETLKSVA